VNCILVVPVLNEWTQYVVTDVNRTVQIAARKLDVNVEHEKGRGKPTSDNDTTQRASVHEGEQKSYDESEVCGAAVLPASALAGVSPKWIAAGAAGAALLILILVHGGGGGNTPVSPSSP
jgi:hypothetical protein